MTIVDKSAISAFVEYLCLSFYGYISSLFQSFGIRSLIATRKEPSSEKNDARDKAQRIEDCLGRHNSVDLWELRELALSEGGLLNGELHPLHDENFRTCSRSIVLTLHQFLFFPFSTFRRQLLRNNEQIQRNIVNKHGLSW